MTGYQRQYRSKPRHPAVRGMEYLMCMAATFAATLGALALWIITT